VPNAAAVAALIRGDFPQLNGAQLAQALQDGALRLGSTLPDAAFGYGRVDALGALATLPAPTITALTDSTIDDGSSTPPVSFTVSGSGRLHLAAASSNAALVPPSIVAAGVAGVTVAPADCGVTTMTCTVSVTPALAQGGTATITLSALDGANRTASATLTVTVTNPTAPPATTPPPTATAPTPAPASHGGGALSWFELACALGLLFPRVSRAQRTG